MSSFMMMLNMMRMLPVRRPHSISPTSILYAPKNRTFIETFLALCVPIDFDSVLILENNNPTKITTLFCYDNSDRNEYFSMLELYGPLTNISNIMIFFSCTLYWYVL